MSRIEDAETTPSTFNYLIFDESIHWRKDSLFHKLCWENWLSACRRLSLDPCISQSKWIEHLNVKAEIPNLLKDTTGKTLKYTSIGRISEQHSNGTRNSIKNK